MIESTGKSFTGLKVTTKVWRTNWLEVPPSLTVTVTTAEPKAFVMGVKVSVAVVLEPL